MGISRRSKSISKTDFSFASTTIIFLPDQLSRVRSDSAPLISRTCTPRLQLPPPTSLFKISAVDREASALNSVVILAAVFPGEPEMRLRGLISDYIAKAVTQEWPMMAHRTATLRMTPYSLEEALQLTLALTPNSQGQQIAQHEITTALENALNARRQRILISKSQVNWVKWSALYLQAVCALIAIAMVHSENRLASAIMMAVFATGVAASVVLINVHDRPFLGQISVGPDPLLQVIPTQASH